MEEGRLGKILLIAGSAGSLAVILRIMPLLQTNMNVTVLIVTHRMSSPDEGVLTEVLSARTSFEVKEVDDKDELRPGVVYIAPPDYHVLFERDGSLTLDDSEKVNYSRPSIDVSFESAAEVYGRSLVCVLLSGANADGAAGLKRVKEKGGRVIVQDPGTADFPMMPQAALEYVVPDLLLKENDIADLTRFL